MSSSIFGLATNTLSVRNNQLWPINSRRVEGILYVHARRTEICVALRHVDGSRDFFVLFTPNEFIMGGVVRAARRSTLLSFMFSLSSRPRAGFFFKKHLNAPRLSELLTFNVLVANPKKLLYTVANPARGLLNGGKRTKEKVWQRTSPPPPHAARYYSSVIYK